MTKHLRFCAVILLRVVLLVSFKSHKVASHLNTMAI